jgi:hypothetical protein
MHYFHHIWKEYFRKLQTREQNIFESFQLEQQRAIWEAHRRSRTRSHSTSREVL